MTYTPTPIYIVLRYGALDPTDAVAEIEKVLQKTGRAWFGKYGQPLNIGIEQLVKYQEQKIYAVLTRKARRNEGSGYVFRMYDVRDISRTVPKRKSSYPAYYLKNLRRIGSWVELEEYSGPKIDLSQLETKSSVQPLLQSLGSSMRAHFFCRSR